MAGTYAHMTLVDSLCQADVLDTIPTLTRTMKKGLMTFANFCELGAVSPDYPYLTVLSDNAKGWANVMHYWKTADFIRSAVPLVFQMDFRTSDAMRCIAWLFGYVAHVVTDLTIHPIVNLRVGDYEHHKRDHRVCEMNQDVYIFHEKGLGDVTSAEYVRAGIGGCCDPADRWNLHPAISGLWGKILGGIPLNEIQMKEEANPPSGKPEIDEWHRCFVTIVDKAVEEGGHLPPLARRFAENEGLIDPVYKDLRWDYVDGLRSPRGGTINYAQAFEFARQNTTQAWAELGSALDEGIPELFTLPNGDLDTGYDGPTSIFWRT